MHIWDWEWEKDQAYSQLLGMGIKIKYPTFGMGNGNENLIPRIWEWVMASRFQKGLNGIGNSEMPFPHLAQW